MLEYLIFLYLLGSIVSIYIIIYHSLIDKWNREETICGAILAGLLSWIYVLIVEYNYYKSLNN